MLIIINTVNNTAFHILFLVFLKIAKYRNVEIIKDNPIALYVKRLFSLYPLKSKTVATKSKIVVAINIRPTPFSIFGNVFLVRSGIQFKPIIIPMNIIIAVIFFQMCGNVDVYEPLRVKARTIKRTKLRWKIPKDFPDRHRPSNGLYTVLPFRCFFSVQIIRLNSVF